LTPQERCRRIPPVFRLQPEIQGELMQYLPGWTVQCINPECPARGHWLRVTATPAELCSNCGAPLHNVPPPLGPRLRMRPRPLGSYRPQGRPR
jgi:hypothetical protein